MYYPFVSVIIPTYHDWERLKLCLNALSEQTYPTNKFELIIINNDPNDPCPLAYLPENCRLAFEEKQGSYAARNKGLKLARGEVIAFTDSDCIPDFCWLEKGVFNLLEHPNCGFIAGAIRLFFANPRFPTCIELYEQVTAFRQIDYVQYGRYGATANLLAFKVVFEQVGLFNSNLISSGDKEWGKRVFSYGYQIFYADDVLVKHPARRLWSEMRQKVLRISLGLYQLSQIESRKLYYLDRIKQHFFHTKRSLRIIYKIITSPEIKGIFLKSKVILVALYMRSLYFCFSLYLDFKYALSLK